MLVASVTSMISMRLTSKTNVEELKLSLDPAVWISVYQHMDQTTFFPLPESGLHMDPAPKMEGESAFNPVNLSLWPMGYFEASLTVSRGRMAMICLPDAGVPYALCSAHRKLTRGRFSQRLVPWRILVLRCWGVLWDESFFMAGRV